ncbi:MAG: PadR family transcriptional regulator [Candidatus Aminicenantes bacterium]|nr:PadR family transcriptional regulator [Candidatus Aminicenantes bacterium]
MKPLTRHEEHVLLTILHLEDNAYLVTIKEYLEEQTSRELSFGTLYVSLKRLEKMGYIRHLVGEATSKRGGKAIKYYTVTKEGVRKLEKAREVQDSMWNGFSRLAVKLKKHHES